MHLVIFNGSPRGEKSNTDILLKQFTDGCDQIGTITYEKHYLKNIKNNPQHIKAFIKADAVILAFPLYADSLPGIVKFFIDSLKTVKTTTKKIGFIVQSGFPESIHSVYVEKYLVKLSRRLKYEYSGTVIKGGVEGIQHQPPAMTKKLFTSFFNLGKHYAETQTFNKEIVSKLRRPAKLPVIIRLLLRFLSLFGIINHYWNKQLKENNAFQKRFDTPYS
jgi:multimeric flavodoxin WrbA